jgi:hypothetical protein
MEGWPGFAAMQKIDGTRLIPPQTCGQHSYFCKPATQVMQKASVDFVNYF